APAPPPAISFVHPDKRSISTRDALAQAALLRLTQLKPQRITLDELVPEACAAAGVAPSPTATAGVAQMIAQLFLRDIVNLYTRPADFTTTPGDRPIARPLARLDAT